MANPGILETTELYLFNSRLLPARISIFDQNQEAEIFKFRWCRQSEFKNQLNLTSKILTRMLHITNINTATKVVNPTLSSTLCQLFVGCNFVRTSTHTNPLATNHVRLAIQMPHTTHSHISCAHCKQLQHSHSLLSFIVATSCAAPLRAHHTRV